MLFVMLFLGFLCCLLCYFLVSYVISRFLMLFVIVPSLICVDSALLEIISDCLAVPSSTHPWGDCGVPESGQRAGCRLSVEPLVQAVIIA